MPCTVAGAQCPIRCQDRCPDGEVPEVCCVSPTEGEVGTVVSICGDFGEDFDNPEKAWIVSFVRPGFVDERGERITLTLTLETLSVAHDVIVARLDPYDLPDAAVGLGFDLRVLHGTRLRRPPDEDLPDGVRLFEPSLIVDLTHARNAVSNGRIRFRPGADGGVSRICKADRVDRSCEMEIPYDPPSGACFEFIYKGFVATSGVPCPVPTPQYVIYIQAEGSLTCMTGCAVVLGSTIESHLNAAAGQVNSNPAILFQVDVPGAPSAQDALVISTVAGTGSIVGNGTYLKVRKKTCKKFRRGDTNSDLERDLSDAVVIVAYLFNGGGRPSCMDAADVNDSGDVDLADGVHLLRQLLLGGPRIPVDPGCSVDPTFDSLECERGACE